MAYSKNGRAFLFCAVSNDNENFLSDFNNQCNIYNKQVHDFYVLCDCISR